VKVVVVMVVVVVLSPFTKFKGKIFPNAPPLHVEWRRLGHEQQAFFIIGFLLPFNVMNYLSIVCRSFVCLSMIINEHFITFLNDQKPQTLSPSSHNLYDCKRIELSKRKETKKHE
jgi:hypothetical protein